jgi:winged helix-turn-helix protein
VTSGTNPVPGGSKPLDRGPLDREQRDAFAARMLSTLTGGALTMLVSVGHRTGLFEAAARGPATSAVLAERAGLAERYVREWLGAMWGTELARDMLTAAGFGQVEVVDSRRPQNCIYICRP